MNQLINDFQIYNQKHNPDNNNLSSLTNLNTESVHSQDRQNRYYIQKMRLLFNPLNEIFFAKLPTNQMEGTVEMTNPTSDTIFAFKVKCTNPELFTVEPIKGIIKPSQKLNLQFKTTDPISLEQARELVSKHKFLIEFVPIISQLSIPNFKSQQSDRKKYYINMDSIRGSRLAKDQEKMSVQSGISNRMSYISMKDNKKENDKLAMGNNNEKRFLTPKRNIQERVSSSSLGRNLNNNNNELNDKYSRLKDQLEDLHRQRQQIVNKMSSTSKKSPINLKKLIVFIICLVIGMFLGNWGEQIVENRRLEAELERKRQEQQKPWRIFGFLDFLYDEVDPQNL